MTGFGPHLVYDGYGCPADRLTDLPGLYHLLDTLPDRIHLTRIMPPCVFRHAADETDGLSGFVPVAGSHISIHTFPARRCFNLDIFSAGPFDVEDALAAIAGRFAPRRVDWRLLDRGIGVPRALDAPHHRAAPAGRSAIARAMGLEVPRLGWPNRLQALTGPRTEARAGAFYVRARVASTHPRPNHSRQT